MNERIRLFAEQAGSTHKQSLGVYQFYSDELEKFAELIVKECVNEVEGLQISKYTSTWDIDQHWNRAIAHTTLHLKQHFGVKE